MLFVYLDEFGHVGPFVSRTSDKHNESPVFGLGGIILPERGIRSFATNFLQLKEFTFAEDLKNAGVPAHAWEKKGSSIFRPKAVERYAAVRTFGFRLLTALRSHGGRVFYYGREKVVGKMDGNANGLYTTILAHAIRRLDDMCISHGENFALVLDEHSARKEFLECAAKTMFGHRPAQHLLSPPFEVESYLNQNIQAADHIATIVGRLWAQAVKLEQYIDHIKFRNYYWDRLHQVTTHSVVDRRNPPRQRGRTKATEATDDGAMASALRKAGFN